MQKTLKKLKTDKKRLDKRIEGRKLTYANGSTDWLNSYKSDEHFELTKQLMIIQSKMHDLINEIEYTLENF